MRHTAPLTALAAIAALLAGTAAAPALAAEPVSILFVGNSYTFGRLDPVLTYNAANVRDLTQPQGPLVNTSTTSTPKFSDVTGTNSYPVPMLIAPGNTGAGNQGNSYSPHSQTVEWGGVPGIFKMFTQQAGLDYDVALSTRNAATLRGHFLNTANATNWDLRGNIGSQKWNKVVLQEQSDEALGPKTVNGVALGSNLPSIRANVDLIEDWIHGGAALSYREQAMYIEQYGSVDNCVAAGGTKRPSPGAAAGTCDNNTLRTVPVNPNASLDTQVFLQQTWARPNLINAPGTAAIHPSTGNATYSGAPAPSYFDSLETMTTEMTAGMSAVAAFAGADGSGGIAGVIPVGQAFLRAVQDGHATRDLYGPGATSDGLIDLWFNDGTHASVHGSYLSALTLFGSITGLDPQSLGANEQAARDLGISGADAVVLQRVAAMELGFAAAVPEPTHASLLLAGLLGLAGWLRCQPGR